MMDPGRALPWMLAVGMTLAGTRWVIGAAGAGGASGGGGPGNAGGGRGALVEPRRWARIASTVGLVLTACALVLGLQNHPLPARPGATHPASSGISGQRSDVAGSDGAGGAARLAGMVKWLWRL